MSGDETLDVWGRAYHDLERRFEALATTDGAVYLPNPEPTGPVDHLLVTMEPSLGGWARTREEAEAKVAAGFRNFVGYEGADFGGGESDYLVYAVRRCLGSSCHVTDISKGAQMPTVAARHAGSVGGHFCETSSRLSGHGRIFGRWVARSRTSLPFTGCRQPRYSSTRPSPRATASAPSSGASASSATSRTPSRSRI